MNITTAAAVSGEFTPEGARQPMRNLPKFCRVAGVSRPTSDSEIQFEVWLPEPAAWNGKFQGIGNGGFAGTISYPGLGGAVSRGYATASTDTGHKATTGIGAAWALNHPEKIVDFGHRAIHETAEVGKAVIKAYYGDGPKRSYFNSCSNGGRQALMEAQRYPNDYDGIIAGAPANYWTHLLSSAGYGVKNLLAEPGAYISKEKLPAIQKNAQASCDKLDGVADGVLEVPTACKISVAPLACTGAETDNCLTKPQLTALEKIYRGLVDKKGKTIFPGISPGGEAEPGGWGPWITGDAREKSAMFGFGTEFFKNMVYSDPNWDYKTFDAARDMKAAGQKTGAALNAIDPDLSRFRARGGKLILYHGWSDAAIPAVNAINYYQSVNKKLGAAKAREFTRLFMAPGMQHCGAGSGPNSFGQFGPNSNTDPSRDINAALEQWVEKGIAPEQIIATKYKGNGPSSGVERTRPLCAYPLVAKYKGTGSTDDAANFTCSR